MSLTSLAYQTLAYVDPNYNYDYNTNYYSNGTASDAAGVAAAAIALIFVYLFVMAAAYVVQALLLSLIFKKAGVERWKAWVPVYNVWCMLELGGVPGFWAILMFIPIVNIAAAIFMYIAMYRIGLNLGKSGAFVLWAIFLPIVWYIWLAVDSSKWQGDEPAEAPSNTPPPSQPAAM